MKMENNFVKSLLSVLILFLVAFILIVIKNPKSYRVPRMENPPPPPIKTDYEFLKAVDKGVKEIEAERIQKRSQNKDKLFCFQCEIDTIVCNYNGNKYCDNCGLIHKNNYHD